MVVKRNVIFVELFDHHGDYVLRKVLHLDHAWEIQFHLHEHLLVDLVPWVGILDEAYELPSVRWVLPRADQGAEEGGPGEQEVRDDIPYERVALLREDVGFNRDVWPPVRMIRLWALGWRRSIGSSLIGIIFILQVAAQKPLDCCLGLDIYEFVFWWLLNREQTSTELKPPICRQQNYNCLRNILFENHYNY
jgi:hypothetical protein